MTVVVVEGSSTVRVVEGVIFAEAVTTTEVVMEPEATATTGVDVETEVKTAPDAAEASTQGDGLLGHRTGKEVVVDVPPGPQEGAGVTESEDEEYANFSSEFFGPSSVIGSSALRSRARVPHPNDIPDRGDVFDDKRLEKLW